MATLAAMTMGDLNQDRKPVYSLFQKPTRPKEASNDQPEIHVASKPLANAPTNIPGRAGKADKTQRKALPSKGKGPDPSLEQGNADVLDIDPNEGRRKRRKTTSPASRSATTSTEVGGETSIAERPRRSGRDSAAIFYGFIPPPEDTGFEDATEGGEFLKLTPTKRGRPRNTPVVVIEDGAETTVVESLANPSHVTLTPASNTSDNHVSGKPMKILKLNPKTGTIGSPPVKKTPTDMEKATKSKKGKSHMVTCQYGPNFPLDASVGEKINRILDGTIRIPIIAKKKPEPPKPMKISTKPPKVLHPLFLGKSALKPAMPDPQKTPSKAPCIIDLTGPTFPKLKSPVRPTANFAGFGAPKIAKVPGAIDPAWPWLGMVHVRGIDERVEEFSVLEPPIASRSRKSKYTATQIPVQEHLLRSVAADLDMRKVLKMAREINLDDYPPLPPCLRIPEKHLESGKRIQQQVRREVHARIGLQPNPDDSSEDELQVAKSSRVFVHPALEKHYNTISTCLSAFDNSQCETQSWINKYSPQSAAEVLQTGPEAFILKEWLQTLTVKSVESGLGGSKGQGKPDSSEVTGKRKRKSKKRDVFIAHSDEDPDLDELTESEDEGSFLGGSLMKKTIVRTINKGKETGKLKNSVLISGPHGCGKTAAVYAVAKELGFEIFEINSSSRRSGKDIMEKVGDMTRNHQVRRQNVFSMPQIDDDHQRIEQALAADIQSGRQGTMQSFFKSKHALKMPAATKPAPPSKKEVPRSNAPKPLPKDQKQSLILIEEVDVLFEEDKSFWATVTTLIATSKRPIIMTCNDESLVLPKLDNDPLHAIIRFNPPPIDLATDHMLLIAACEGHIIRREAVEVLYQSRKFDLRASISELNFWCQFGVGDQKHGGDWYYRRYPGNDTDSHGHKIRVVSENTYHAGMGCVSRDFLDGEMTLGVEEEILHELWDGWDLDAGDWQAHSPLDVWANSLDTSRLSALEIYGDFAEHMSVADLCSASTFATQRQDNLDTSLPLLKEKVLEDYILGRKVIQASPIQHYQTLGKDMSIYLKSQARHILHTHPCSGQLPPRAEKDIINFITTPSTTKAFTRQDLSLAFDPISYAPNYIPSASLEPSVFDRTTRIITLDVAPYVRGIVAYDARLAKERLDKSTILSEGGNGIVGRKRIRTTRAALSALEGGVRSATRREKWFGNLLNAVIVGRTAGGGWYRAIDREVKRRIERDGLAQEGINPTLYSLQEQKS